ncbi:MAG: ribose transport system permease protein [Candidatus Atribacteria bacterium]|nr:ribose transport system permease protein [Candidatus Atribacteria bacterium]
MSAGGASPSSQNLLRNRRAVNLGRYWVYLFFLGELIIFSILGTNFFSAQNLQNILVASTTILLLAAGETFVILTGGIDLSVGFVMGLSCVICAKIMVTLQALGLPGSVAILLGIAGCLLIGLLPGLLNGFLIAKLRVPPFIATFGMYGIAYGLAEIISNNVPISGLPPQAGFVGNGYLLYYLPGKALSWFSPPQGISRQEIRQVVPLFPNVFLLAIIAVAIFGFILARTQFGQHTYAIGGSVDAARRAGILVDRHLIKVYMISSFFAALGGVMFTLRYVTGRADAGSARMLDAIAAVVIGGASLYGGTGTMIGSIIGTLIIGVLETGMVNLGLPTYNKYVYVGIILIMAVLIDQFFPEETKGEV